MNQQLPNELDPVEVENGGMEWRKGTPGGKFKEKQRYRVGTKPGDYTIENKALAKRQQACLYGQKKKSCGKKGVEKTRKQIRGTGYKKHRQGGFPEKEGSGQKKGEHAKFINGCGTEGKESSARGQNTRHEVSRSLRGKRNADSGEKRGERRKEGFLQNV